VAGAHTKRLSARDRCLGKGWHARKKYCTRLFAVREPNFQGLYPSFWGGRGGGGEGWKQRTMHLFQTWLFWDWCSGMFVERTPVTGELQLFMNIDALISEDLHPVA
jgi:hypothetical protein